MPKFTVQMMREVISYDSYEIEITAQNERDAYFVAQAKINELNSNCPDDIKELGHMHTGSWQVDKVIEKEASGSQAANC